MSGPPSRTGSDSSGQGGVHSKSTNPIDDITAPNTLGAPSSSPDSKDHGFALAPKSFDAEKEKAAFLERQKNQQGQGSLNPAEAAQESVEDEINRQIAELEKVRKARITEKEKRRITARIRSLREGGWLEGLKLVLVGKDSVPIEYWNRLVDEHEGTIPKVVGMLARAQRKLAEKDAQINALKDGVEKTYDSTDLRRKLAECESHGNRLEDEIQMVRGENSRLQSNLDQHHSHNQQLVAEIAKLQDELEHKSLKPDDDTHKDKDTLGQCRNKVADLQRKLETTETDLKTARSTSSRFYGEAQEVRQQKLESNERERRVKDQARDLIEQVDRLKKEIAVQHAPGTDEDKDKEVKHLEEEIDRLKKEVSELQAKNMDLNDTVALREEIMDTKRFRKQISNLESERAKCEAKVKALESDLEQARNASSKMGKTGAAAKPEKKPDDDDDEDDKGDDVCQKLVNQLRARCKHLQEARDNYLVKWARRVMNRDANLREFWQAVENTKQEINQLHQGIETLSRAVGLGEIVVSAPQTLDDMVRQVTGSLAGLPQSLQLSVLRLRYENSMAQVEIGILQHQLDNAQLARSEDEIKVQLQIVNEQNVEQRVTIRTQTYRDYRGAFIDHLFDAQVEFMALAVTSVESDAIIALVDRFLQPASLPLVRLAQGRR
jgi:DNA repair exonuclease SbcCD ATPase subunit